ncbi:hypothetical protein INT45_011683 [Circinella minor]|uniref:DASH complex subunit DUO1 n=1 Tax=Circinella minor TaxID=1195481 RepID=A0A8H7SD54_9FUNG|nr:hypothetical protein INT45_011683 [Circinella minor]
MNNEGLPPTTPRPPRESLLPTQRWVTNLYTSSGDLDQPVENPSNPPELNAQLRQEFEQLRKLNQTAQALLESFEQTRSNFDAFEASVDQTDQLLDLWTKILSQSEHTKQRLEDPKYHGSASPTQSLSSTLPPALQQLQISTQQGPVQGQRSSQQQHQKQHQKQQTVRTLRKRTQPSSSTSLHSTSQQQDTHMRPSLKRRTLRKPTTFSKPN